MTVIKLLDMLLPLTGFRLVIGFWGTLMVIGAILAYFQVDQVPTGTGKHPFGCTLTILSLAGLIISLMIHMIL